VGAEEHKPEDFALLVRVYANNVEERLKEAFAERNLLLRNDARILEQFSIQDLVKEALFDYLMSLLKLTVHVRSGMPYQTAESFLSDVRGTDLQDARQAKGIQDEMRVAVAATREAIGQSVPQETDFARLCAALHGSIPAAAVKNALPSLRADDRYGAYLASFDQFMRENIDRAASWPSLIDAMEGRGQVRLMTIHKSKGLEFHTVFFLDLHDGSWFSTGEGEENSFFVALSRARERVFFLNSNIAKGALRLVTFSDALDAAGVPEIQ